MTSRANTVGPTMVGREPGVVEGGIEPRRGRMACLARRRETGGGMVRVGRGLVVGFMA